MTVKVTFHVLSSITISLDFLHIEVVTYIHIAFHHVWF